MVGALVRHQQYGEGRVVANNRGHLRVLFFGDNTEQEFGADAENKGAEREGFEPWSLTQNR